MSLDFAIGLVASVRKRLEALPIGDCGFRAGLQPAATDNASINHYSELGASPGKSPAEINVRAKCFASQQQATKCTFSHLDPPPALRPLLDPSSPSGRPGLCHPGSIRLITKPSRSLLRRHSRRQPVQRHPEFPTFIPSGKVRMGVLRFAHGSTGNWGVFIPMYRIVSLSETGLQIVTLYDAKGWAVSLDKNDTSATPSQDPSPSFPR